MKRKPESIWDSWNNYFESLREQKAEEQEEYISEYDLEQKKKK